MQERKGYIFPIREKREGQGLWHEIGPSSA